MVDLLGYKGKTCVVAGCHSGIGAATAKALVALGAEVHGLDIRPAAMDLASFTTCDLRHPEEIDKAIDGLPAKIDALFYCAGLPQTFPALDVLRVNFLSVRHMVEKLRPRMGSGSGIAIIASTAGNGYVLRLPTVTEFVTTSDHAAGIAWAEPRVEELGDPYMFSKEAVIVWAMREAQTLIRDGIRINTLSPGPTQSVMMKDFESVSSPKIIDVYTAPIFRRSTPEEQAWPLVFLNSAGASYVNGTNFIADGGFTAGMGLGLIDLDTALQEAMK